MRASSSPDDAEARRRSIEGLSPAISIEQKTTSKNPRSTVGTVTEIYDYLRLLYARVGVRTRPRAARPIEARPSRRWWTACWRCRRGHAALPARAGRARAQGRVQGGADESAAGGFPARASTASHRDRRRADARQAEARHRGGGRPLVVRPDCGSGSPSRSRRRCQGDGIAVASSRSTRRRRRRASREKFACPSSASTLRRVEPRLFSFNNRTAPARAATASAPSGDRPRPDRPGHVRLGRRRRDRALGGRQRRRLVLPDPRGAATATSRLRHALEGASRRAAATDPLRHRRREDPVQYAGRRRRRSRTRGPSRGSSNLLERRFKGDRVAEERERSAIHEPPLPDLQGRAWPRCGGQGRGAAIHRGSRA